MEQAVEAFPGFDWRRELAAYDENDKTRNCLPGIGIHNGYDDSKHDAGAGRLDRLPVSVRNDLK